MRLRIRMPQRIRIVMGRIHIRMGQLIRTGRFMGQLITRRLSRLDLDIRPMAITTGEAITAATITVVRTDIIMRAVFTAAVFTAMVITKD